MADVRTDGSARNVLDAADLSVREDDLTSNDHVFDSAVEGGELTDASGGNESAHLSQRLGLRGVSRGQASLLKQIVQILQRHAALAGDLHVGLVDLQNLIHFGTVDDDRVFQSGFQSSLDGGVTGAGYDVDSVLIRKLQNF